MLTRPTDVVDLWHDENLSSLGYAPNFGKEIATARRQMVREDWPELGEMLDKLPPSSVRSVVEPEPKPEGTIIDVPWYAVVVVGMILFVAGMVVQKFVVGS
jgi:hypothetical protein